MRRSRDLIILIVLLVLVHVAALVAAWWMRDHYELASPQMLWGLLLVPVLSIWYVIRRNQRRPHATLSTLSALRNGSSDAITPSTLNREDGRKPAVAATGWRSATI